MRTLRQKRGSSGAWAAITLLGALATTFGVAGEAAAQDVACEGGGYGGSTSGLSHSTSDVCGGTQAGNCPRNGHNGKGDAQQSAKDYASAACDFYCASLDACSDNKPYCKGTVKMGRMTCYLFCWSYPCVWFCNASYTCTCGCSSNSAQAAIAAINVPLDEAGSDELLADFDEVAEVASAENPFEGSWEGTYIILTIGDIGTAEFTISKTGVLKGSAFNETDGVGAKLVGVVDADGWMHGVSIGDGGGAQIYSGTCSIDEDGNMICDLSSCFQDSCIEFVVTVAPV